MVGLHTEEKGRVRALLFANEEEELLITFAGRVYHFQEYYWRVKYVNGDQDSMGWRK